MRIAHAAMAWTGLYVVSKVSYALEGRLHRRPTREVPVLVVPR
ncbi:hypothetical protein [Nonomuraea sp. NPDC049400]